MANSKMATVTRTNILIKVERSAATTKAYVQYESCNIYYSEVMINVKCQGKKKISISRKVLSLEILLWNIKALALTVHKLLARLKISKDGWNSKVKG